MQNTSAAEDPEVSADNNLEYLFPVEYQQNVGSLASENIKLKMELESLFRLLKQKETEPTNIELGDRLAQEIREKLAFAHDNDQLTERNSELERLLSQANADKVAIQNQLNEKIKELEALRREREGDDVTVLMQENDHLRERLEDLQKETREKSGELTALKSKVKELAAQNQNSNEDIIQKLNNEIESLKQENQSLRGENQKLIDEIEKKLDAIQDLEGRISHDSASESLKEEKEKLQKENEQLRLENGANASKIKDMEDALKNLEQEVEEAMKLKQENEDLQKQVSNLLSRVQELETNNEKLTDLDKELGTLKDANEYLTLENNQLRDENKKLHATIQDLESKRQSESESGELDSLQKENEELHRELESTLNELEKLKELHIDQLTEEDKAELLRLRSNNKLLEGRVDELNDALTKLQDEMDQLLEAFDVESPSEAIDKLSLFLDESSRLRSEKEELLRNEKELNDTIKELQAKSGQMQEAAAKTVADLREQNETLERERQEMVEALLGAKDELEEVKREQEMRLRMARKDIETSPGTPKKSKIPTPGPQRVSPLSDKINKTEAELERVKAEKERCELELEKQKRLVEILILKLQEMASRTVSFERKISDLNKKLMRLITKQSGQLSSILQAISQGKFMPMSRFVSIISGLVDVAWRNSEAPPPNMRRTELTRVIELLRARIGEIAASPRKGLQGLNPRVVRLVQQVRTDFGAIARGLRTEHEELMERIENK